jgi:hypothetical protein
MILTTIRISHLRPLVSNVRCRQVRTRHVCRPLLDISVSRLFIHSLLPIDIKTRNTIDTTIQPNTKGDAPEAAVGEEMTPYVVEPPHEPFPIAMVCRKPYGGKVLSVCSLLQPFNIPVEYWQRSTKVMYTRPRTKLGSLPFVMRRRRCLYRHRTSMRIL